MKSKSGLILSVAICTLLFLAIQAWAQDPGNEAAMSLLKDFFADSAARADYASRNPDARQAEQNLQQFPPDIQKRIEKVVLMIMRESGVNAAKHVEASQTSGAEGAFLSFSLAVQREILAIARELEKNPEFMKKAGASK